MLGEEPPRPVHHRQAQRRDVAALATAVGGELVVNVVDDDALASMEIVCGRTPAPASPLSMPVGSSAEIFLLAYTAEGVHIVGKGPEPSISIAAPIAVLAVEEWTRDYGDVRRIQVDALAAGEVLADIIWGPLRGQLLIKVTQ